MKIKFENSIRTYKIQFFVPSNGNQNCLEKSLGLYESSLHFYRREDLTNTVYEK